MQTTQPSFDLSFDDLATTFSARSDAELNKMYVLFATMNNSSLVEVGTSLLKFAFKINFPVKTMVKNTVFEHFCGGENVEDCEKTIKKLSQFNVGTILDYSVEGEKSEKGFDETEKEILRTVSRAKNSQTIPFCVFKVTGIGNFDLLEAVSAQKGLTTEQNEAWGRVIKRADNICKASFEANVRVFIDAEETWIQPAIDQIADMMMFRYNKNNCIVYNTYQMYCRNSLPKFQAAIQDAKNREYILGAKLVRGAYMERERARASEKGYADPIQPNKQASDYDFDEAVKLSVQNIEHVAICAGTHNEASSLLLARLMYEQNISRNHPHIYFAQLFGMSDNLSYCLSKKGYNVAKYVPYGPIKAVMPYLFRRAAENTAMAGQTSREFALIQREMKRRSEARKNAKKY
ncbi:MAG: proline dehydrogenase [Cytophagales bacterium]|nr:MAG: proline dehydrogenase [Cytophagales bacterium]TAF61715.1 MAG: proline dehydrogenase [Cytophagales bacterium]